MVRAIDEHVIIMPGRIAQRDVTIPIGHFYLS
jgi:hypothetical protein